MKTSIIALAAALSMGTAALAQDAGTPDAGQVAGAEAMADWQEIDDSVMVTQLNATADDVDDMDLYDAEGTKIGEVEKVLGTSAETPGALVVDFDDDSVYGDGDRVVPLEYLSMTDDRLTLSAEADVAGFEGWDD